jgi:hypothetical protein
MSVLPPGLRARPTAPQMLTSATKLTPPSVKVRSSPRRHPWRLRDGPASDMVSGRKGDGRTKPNNGGISQHGEGRSKRPNATAAPPHQRHHGASGQPSGGRAAAIWRGMAAIIHKTPSTARRRWQNEEGDESPAKGRLQPHSARPASGAYPRQHGRKSGAKATPERSPAYPSGAERDGG